MTDEDMDLEQFARLVCRHQLEATRFVRLRVGAEHTDDVVQDVWEAAWRARIQASIDLAYLLALARTRTDRHRAVRRRRRGWVQIDQLEAVALGAGADEQVETREDAAKVRCALLTLSPRDQQVMHLAFVLKLRHAEIAAVLGLPTTNAASKAVSVARRRFRMAWEAQER